jgi:hypothetical protein
MPPPAEARLPGGRVVELAEAATEICRRYADEEARYGEAWMPWCRHDDQHILNWAAEDVAGFNDLDRHLDWLWACSTRGASRSSGIPRNVELGADVLRERGEADVAERPARAAVGLRARH